MECCGGADQEKADDNTGEACNDHDEASDSTARCIASTWCWCLVYSGDASEFPVKTPMEARAKTGQCQTAHKGRTARFVHVGDVVFIYFDSCMGDNAARGGGHVRCHRHVVSRRTTHIRVRSLDTGNSYIRTIIMLLWNTQVIVHAFTSTVLQ